MKKKQLAKQLTCLSARKIFPDHTAELSLYLNNTSIEHQRDPDISLAIVQMTA